MFPTRHRNLTRTWSRGDADISLMDLLALAPRGLGTDAVYLLRSIPFAYANSTRASGCSTQLCLSGLYEVLYLSAARRDSDDLDNGF